MFFLRGNAKFVILLLLFFVIYTPVHKTHGAEPELKVKPFGKAYLTLPQWKVADIDPDQSDIIFDMTRFYLGFNWEYDTVYGKVTTDIRRSTETRNTAGDLLRLMKHGYAGWQYTKNHALELGLLSLEAAQPWENMFRRYIVKSTLDENNLTNTADMGIQATGKCADGLFQYFLALINGEGFHAPEETKGKDASLRLVVRPEKKDKKGFTFAGYAHVGRTISKKSRDRYDVQAFYSWPTLTLGTLLAYTLDDRKDQRIVSALLDWEFFKKWFVLARVDHVDPDGTKDNHQLWIAGIEYQFNKYLNFALDAQKEWQESSKDKTHLFAHVQLQF